ncbi:hypothetical protein EU538_05170 [Candidatus Thorarchaeota archaeon]|nr:MAG: hypothetical protein EU538_05170 [Candidatus Thorarchaeota archaeon]
MVKEIVIMRDGGIPLFHYSVHGTKKLDEIVSAFLSAIGSFAEAAGREQLTVMAFVESKFVWLKKGDLFFIALVAHDDSSEIYRVILEEIADSFVSRFYAELRRDFATMNHFRFFTDTVELILQKFDGIPSLARKYETALLPSDELRQLKTALFEAEANDSILRGGLLTWDGRIVVSNLKAYELEAVLDFMNELDRNSLEERIQLVNQAGLDAISALLIGEVEVGLCTFVVLKGQDVAEYAGLLLPFFRQVGKTDFSKMRLIRKEENDEPGAFAEHDAIELLVSHSEAISRARSVFDGHPTTSQSMAIEIIQSSDGKKTVGEIAEESLVPKERLGEVLAHLISKGIVRIVKLFPVMNERDERFAAYLEIIGMPKRDYDVIDSIWKYCDGSLSLSEISARSSIPVDRIMEVLKKLGKHVSWETNRELLYIR